MFAGIWDTWHNRGQVVSSCAIITTTANEVVGKLHDRMPAILPAEAHAAWLDRRADRVQLMSMLVPFPAAKTKTYPVSSHVNQPNVDTPDLITRVDAEVGKTLSLF